MTAAPTGGSGSGSSRRAREGVAATAIAVMLLAVTMLIIFTNTSNPDIGWLEYLYAQLYYVPIVYAAFVFGSRGGALTAFVAAIPLAIHAQLSLGGLLVSPYRTLIEIAMFFGAGIAFGLLRDSEDRKAADARAMSAQLEQAYKKLEERAIQLINIQDYMQSILRSITSGVITVGPDASVATANPAAERMLGMSEYEMVPKSVGTLFRDDGGISTDVTKVLAGRLPLTLREVTLVTSSGKEVHAQVSVSRMRAVGGKILGAVVTLEDVSDIKALTDQLIRADRLAAMGELTAGVAHEVRNPLGVIRASVQLLEDSTASPERVHEAAEVIKQEIDRLDRVIKALLDFGRPSKPTLVPINVEEILKDVELFTNRFAKQSSVQIVEDFAGDIPDVVADPDQMKQVFLNLVTNAVQAMESGGGGQIVLHTETDDDFVTVAVSDDGPGIPEAELGKVFDPFFTKRAEGTGLGLTIVHRIIDEHDGHIELVSGPEGTTFVVSLPVALGE